MSASLSRGRPVSRPQPTASQENTPMPDGSPVINPADAAESEQENSNGKSNRAVGPKTVYIQLKEGVSRDSVISVHTNTRTLVDAMEQNPGSTYVKHTLPQGEPRGPKGPKQA